MKYLAIKNFGDFQHYRDRNPPWIKLYARLLTDLTFLELPEAAQAQLVKLWILASQMGNPLPNNPRLLAGKIGATGKFHLAAIVASGFLIPCNESASTTASIDASVVLADSEQDASMPVRADLEIRGRGLLIEEERAEKSSSEPNRMTALELTVWANRAVAERWGEQPTPLIQVNAIELAEKLGALGVDARIARLSIYRQCRESKQPRPPRGQNYFRRGIEEDWQQELARRAVASSGEQPPPQQQRAKANGREHWRDRNAREATEDQAAGEWRLLTMSVETRRAQAVDGDVWWRRMQQQSGLTGADLYRYAAQHLGEAAHATA